MSKYIWEYGRNYRGEPYKNKYKVVYENKTYYYCKEPARDELIELLKIKVDNSFYTNPTFVTEKLPDKNSKISLLKLNIERVKCDITVNETTIDACQKDIKNKQEKLAALQKQLNDMENN